jgi:hypothetical protein
MAKITWVPAWAALFMTACSTTHSVGRPPSTEQLNRINEAARDRELDVEYRPASQEAPTEGGGTAVSFWEPEETATRYGHRFHTIVSFDRKSVVLESSEGRDVRVPPIAVQQVQVVRHGKGALDGALWGFTIGAGTGAILGLASGQDRCPCLVSWTPGEKALIYGAMLGVVGLAAGTVAGLVRGHREVFVFDRREEPMGTR